MARIIKATFVPNSDEESVLEVLGAAFIALWNRAVEFGKDFYKENGKFPLKSHLYPILCEWPEYLAIPSGIAYAVIQEQDYWYRQFIRALVRRDLPAERFLPSKYPDGSFPRISICSTALKQLDGRVRISLGKVIQVKTGQRFLYIPCNVKKKVKFCAISKINDTKSEYLIQYWCK